MNLKQKLAKKLSQQLFPEKITPEFKSPENPEINPEITKETENPKIKSPPAKKNPPKIPAKIQKRNEAKKTGQPDLSHAHTQNTNSLWGSRDLSGDQSPVSNPESLSGSRELTKKPVGCLTDDEKKQLEKLQPLIRTRTGKSILRASKKLADYITEEDVAESAQVIREAKRATHRIYSAEEHRLLEVPDFRTRLAAATLERAYDEGTPIQRQVVLTGKFDTDEAIMGKLSDSEEALRAIETLSRLGIRVDYRDQEAEQIIDAEPLRIEDSVRPES